MAIRGREGFKAELSILQLAGDTFECVDTSWIRSLYDFISWTLVHKATNLLKIPYTDAFCMFNRYESEFASKLDWQAAIIERLAQHLDNGNTDDIAVLGFSDPPHISFQWKNDSLSSHTCPDPSKIQKILDELVVNKLGALRGKVKGIMMPEFDAKQASLKFLSPCADMESPVEPPTTIEPERVNFPPVLVKPIDQIRGRVGELLRYTVPYDTFYDTEDGHSRYMQLTLKTNDYQPIPEDSWLQFDVKNREFYGLPMQKDIGRKEYTLVSHEYLEFSSLSQKNFEKIICTCNMKQIKLYNFLVSFVSLIV